MHTCYPLLAAFLCTFLLGSGPASLAHAEPPPLPFSPPAVEPEELRQGEAIPYFKPLPGMKVDSWQLDEAAIESIQTSRFSQPHWIGPPLLRLTYSQTDAARKSARAVSETYRQALTKAGWQVFASAGSTIAHYGQNHRSIWLKFSCDQRLVHITICDFSANYTAAKLYAELQRTGHVTVRGLLFEINKEYLRPESDATMLQLLKLLHDAPTLKIEIRVHTDSSFRDIYSHSPSQNRAEYIRNWLIKHGADSTQLTANGYGETIPLHDNKTPEGRALNRRVELVLLRNPAAATPIPTPQLPAGTPAPQ